MGETMNEQDCSSGIGNECKDWGDAGDPPHGEPTAAQLARQARHPISWKK